MGKDELPLTEDDIAAIERRAAVAQEILIEAIEKMRERFVPAHIITSCLLHCALATVLDAHGGNQKKAIETFIQAAFTTVDLESDTPTLIQDPN